MRSLKTRIVTPLLEETRHFYEAVFELTVVEEWDDPDDRGVILNLPDGHREALLEICYGSENHDFAGLSLQVRVEDLDEFVLGLPEDVDFDGPTRRRWGSTYLYLRDPNDLLVIVYEGGW